jgi:lipopolysaccharide transport system permease protein
LSIASTSSKPPSEPAPHAQDVKTTIIEPTRNLFDFELRELWAYRELVYFMVLRDVSTRYKQTALGVGWALLQPLLTMLIFTMVFSHVARIPTGDVPYPLFAFTALVPWTYFSGAVGRTSSGLVRDSNLISKVYFPRLIIPFAAAVTPLVDLALIFLMLGALLAWYHVTPGIEALMAPVFVLMAFAAAMGIGLWLSALNVRYRDVSHLIPFIIQVGLFASPVAYPTHLVPEQWQLFYSLNPMVCVIEGFRWALLGAPAPTTQMITMGLLTIAVLLPSGLFYFRATERTFADII